jgi:hypothetical protein
MRLLLFTFRASVRYGQVSLSAGCIVFLFNVKYNAATYFGHIFWPSSGSYKFDRSEQCIRQFVKDVFLPHTHLYYNNTTINATLLGQGV